MKKSSFQSYIWTLALAILMALSTRFFLVTAYKVPTGSMQPTLKPGDFIFASKVSYGLTSLSGGWWFRWSEPQPGDVVVFSYPNQPQVNYVKRVVGLPGDEIKIEKDELWVNGQKMNYEDVPDQSDNPNPENFILRREKDTHGSRSVIQVLSSSSKPFGPLKVPEGEIFLLGDNRDASDDSRSWGTVPTSLISARVKWVWLSLDWQKKWAQNRIPQVRWERLFSRVQ